MSRFFSVVLLLMASFVITGCQNSDSKKATEQVVDEDKAEYSKASCLFKFEEGPTAPALDPKSAVSTTYFQKNIDLNLFRPVLAVSGAEVVRFGEKTGVKFYKTVAARSNSCEFGASIPLAPSDLEREFSDNAKK